MTECAIYRAGGREQVDGDISDALDAILLKDEDAFCWIDLHEPTEEEFKLASEELNLHPLAVEDALNSHQRPKLERYDKVVLVVIKALTYDEATQDVEDGEILVFVGRNYVVTVRHGDIDPLTAVRRRLEGDPGLLSFGSPVVLYGILDAVVDEYVEIADKVQEAVTGLEERVFVVGRGALAADIYALKREVLQMHNAVQPLLPVCNTLLAGGVVRLTPEAVPFFRDVADHATHVNAKIESLNELLPQVLSAYLAQVGMQQNDDARKITSWAAIMAVPTMVAGIYGMNFTHMPELNEMWGYPMALGFIVFSCVLLFVLFKRSRWL
ncbi:magnesium/cobalt transporter CorA [Actinorugispora endophytica]|uniref:Magnesium transport protein CorA n=1 Tax=Actinorugispora endophytica TaxID=1605990 RepID=A0A4R6V3F1_9ACTN|nr:magnesium/cobalt transporter CorA [Actinorugispora endophytica]TDQ53067.1 magnesium transporter [Actinorugispora endophytica]